MSIRIAVINGSLRKASFSGAICDTLPELAESAEFVRVDYAAVPFYNEDLKENGSPAPVRDVVETLQGCDALIFVTPEYNRAMSGAMKNLIDWLSKEPEAPLKGKAALVITQSPGAVGGLTANYNLRQVLSVCGAHLVTGFEVAIGAVGSKVTDGRLTDQKTRDFVADNLRALSEIVTFTRRHAA